MDYGHLTLEHVKRYDQEIIDQGLDKGLRTPILLPDYRYEKALTQIHQ